MSASFNQADFLKKMQGFLLGQLAKIPLALEERDRLFLELDKISKQLSVLIKSTLNKIGFKMIDYIIHVFEGKKSNDKFDPGRATMFGLSEKYNPEIADKIIAGTLTYDEAIEVYRTKYYESIYGVAHLLPSIAFIILDAKIHGSRESVRDLQRWINKSMGAQLDVDGNFGELTFAYAVKITKAEFKSLYFHLEARKHESARASALRVLAVQKRDGLPSYDYTKGFTARLSKRYAYALALVEGDQSV